MEVIIKTITFIRIAEWRMDENLLGVKLVSRANRKYMLLIEFL